MRTFKPFPLAVVAAAAVGDLEDVQAGLGAQGAQRAEAGDGGLPAVTAVGRRLLGALEAHPGAAFAYGILQQVTRGRPNDIMSWLGWEPERLRYGNFIDAMAMMRRDVLLEVGGYPTDPRLYGWEDFALWCELAERGHDAVQVLEIVATYHAAAHSMISITNIDSAEAWATLTRRHPFLEGAPLSLR
jgi:hypothetical protein